MCGSSLTTARGHLDAPHALSPDCGPGGAPRRSGAAAVRTAAREAGLSEIVIGVRPEHLHLAGSSGELNGSSELAGEVIMVEELGADALLHVRLAEGGNPVVARAEGRKPPAPGQTVAWHVRTDDVFAFTR